MTLLIGMRARDHVVLLADGMSLNIEEEKTTVADRKLQKLFALRGAPVGMAHFGQNRLGALPVKQLLQEDKVFQRSLTRCWADGLNSTAATAILELDSTVSQTLKSAKLRKDFGLWLSGLWPCTEIPEIVEVYWRELSINRVRVSVKALGDISIGGSGMKYILDYTRKPLDKQFDKDKIFTGSIEYSMQFAKRLYEVASERQKQAGETLFGGQQWMAVITRDGVDLGPT